MVFKTTEPDFGSGASQFPGVARDPLEGQISIGSPRVYRRTGKAILIESFECDLNSWLIHGPGPCLDAEKGQWFGTSAAGLGGFVGHGSACAYIRAPSCVDADGDNRAELIKRLPQIWHGNLGIEVLIAADQDVHFLTMQLVLWEGPAVAYTPAGIGLDLVAVPQVIEYRSVVAGNYAATYTTLAPMPHGDLRSAATEFTDYWANLKLVIKDDLSEYLRFSYNDQNYDMRGIPIPSVVPGAATHGHLGVVIGVYDNDGTQAYGFVDAIIITQDEPER